VSTLGYLFMVSGTVASPSPTSSVSSCPCVNTTPTPGPGIGIGDTVAMAAPWQWTLPLVITMLLGAATAAGIIWTIIQRHRSDRRQQLWNRMQWALDAATSDDEVRAFVGALAIEHLLEADGQPSKKGGPPIKMTTYNVDLLNQTFKGLD